MKFLNKHFKTIVIVGLVLFIVFLLKECNGEKNKNKEIELKSAILDQQHKQDSIQFSQQVTRWQDSIYNAGINSDLQAKVIKETEKKYRESLGKIVKLSEIIRNSPQVPDSSFVLVSPGYKDACDSLPGEIDKMNAALLEKDTAINDLIDLMNYEVVYRDSLIELGKGYIDSLRSDYNAQKVLLNQALKVGKPRGKLLTGVGIMGNQEKILGGGSVKIGYLTKRDKLYLYSPHLLQLPGMPKAGLYHEATVMFNPFK